MLGTKSIRHLVACLFAAHAALASTLMDDAHHYGQWTNRVAAEKLLQWREMQTRYLLDEGNVPEQCILDQHGGTKNVRGAVLLVSGAWAPIQERPLFDNVYYSGSAPYKNEPPDFALARRTMLDILRLVNLGPDDTGWGREQSVALTYLGRIRPLLLQISRCVSAEACTNLQKVLAQALAVYQGAQTLDCWNVFNNLQTKLKGKTLTCQDAGKAYSGLKDAFNALVKNYNTRMEIYRRELDQPKTSNRDYSTHCEIMYLYEVWKREISVDTFQNALCGLLRRMHVPPTALIISKPMCENCEPNIVKAWTGGIGQDLYVVTEREPNEVEKKYHDASSCVKKIDFPLNGRKPYVPR